jgi:predicted P-loop ATPase/GTPase
MCERMKNGKRMMVDRLSEYTADWRLVCAEMISTLKHVAMAPCPPCRGLNGWYKYSVDRSDDQVRIIVGKDPW